MVNRCRKKNTIFNENLFLEGDLTAEIQEKPPKVVCKEKVFQKISQNSQENTCASASF